MEVQQACQKIIFKKNRIKILFCKKNGPGIKITALKVKQKTGENIC